LAGKDLNGLFLAHRRELYLYLAERLNDREMAADLAQETFLRFAEKGADITVVCDRSYLYRIARNLAIDHVRGVNSRRTDATAHDDLANIAEDRPDPEQIVDARARLDRLRAVIRELPERTRRVFALHRIEELTYDEVAKRMGISESSVQKHLAKALRHVIFRTGGSMDFRCR
jgi:RNA polymerase sigma factor (sigma-70 family)